MPDADADLGTLSKVLEQASEPTSDFKAGDIWVQTL